MASREEIEAKKAAGLCVKAGCGSVAFERWTYCEKHLPPSFTLARTVLVLQRPPFNAIPPRPRRRRPDSN